MVGYKKAICYSGYRKGQSPKGIFPTYEQVKEDLQILDKEYNLIRMYEPCAHSRMAIEVIKKEGLSLKVMLGIDLISEYNSTGCSWVKQNFSDEELQKHAQYNDNQLKELIELANENPDVIEYVSAGNEARPYWGDNLVTEERIAYFVKELKSKVKQKVTYCEGADIWFTGAIPEITKEVDFVSAHIYPFWNKVTIEDAIDYTNEVYNKIVSAIPDKEIVITEAGWPMNSSLADVHNIKKLKAYHEKLNDWAYKNDVLLFVFEAFDEPWKGSENKDEPEKHWGIMDQERNPKF